MKYIVIALFAFLFTSCDNCYSCHKGGGFQGGVGSAPDTYEVCIEGSETEAEFRERLQQEVNNRRYDACVKKGAKPIGRNDLNED